MRTKVSLALGRRGPLSRQTAWGCLTTNLALPGFGSLVAGRAVGYAQVAVTVAGLALTTVFGTRFIFWDLANWTRLRKFQEDDPFANLGEIWMQVRWALLGIAIFVVAILWALQTSLSILREARANEPPVKCAPPKLR